jgi:hypothetical protein
MRIETSSGHTILADDADYPLLGDYSWYVCKTANGRFYAHARVRGTEKRVSMHRLLMNPPPELVVHHKNNDGLDNRRFNLQVTTQRVNIRHALIEAACVHFDKGTGRWCAQPRDETGKQIFLGVFDTEKQAKATVSNWRYRKLIELENAGETDLADTFEKCLLAQEQTR